jgi:MYXO-CTERM domain-containing protein
VCDAAGTRVCVECTATNTKNCQATLTGARCLPNDTCGCTSDADCGGPTSGRVCDTARQRCRPVGLVPDGGAPDAPRDSAPPDLPRDLPPDVAVDAPRPPDAPGPDVAVLVDAAADAARDAGADATGDASGDARSDGSSDATRPGSDAHLGRGFLGGGGCRCALPGSGSPAGPGTSALASLVVLALVWRRRRKR